MDGPGFRLAAGRRVPVQPASQPPWFNHYLLTARTYNSFTSSATACVRRRERLVVVVVVEIYRGVGTTRFRHISSRT